MDEAIKSTATRTKLYVTGTIITAAIAVTAIVLLAIVRPDNTSTGTIILGLLLPIITAFLAASIGHLGAQIDGRLTQLLELTAKSSKAEGKAVEKEETAKAMPEGPIAVAVINKPTVVLEKE